VEAISGGVWSLEKGLLLLFLFVGKPGTQIDNAHFESVWESKRPGSIPQDTPNRIPSEVINANSLQPLLRLYVIIPLK